MTLIKTIMKERAAAGNKNLTTLLSLMCSCIAAHRSDQRHAVQREAECRNGGEQQEQHQHDGSNLIVVSDGFTLHQLVSPVSVLQEGVNHEDQGHRNDDDASDLVGHEPVSIAASAIRSIVAGWIA